MKDLGECTLPLKNVKKWENPVAKLRITEAILFLRRLLWLFYTFHLLTQQYLKHTRWKRLLSNWPVVALLQLSHSAAFRYLTYSTEKFSKKTFHIIIITFPFPSFLAFVPFFFWFLFFFFVCLKFRVPSFTLYSRGQYYTLSLHTTTWSCLVALKMEKIYFNSLRYTSTYFACFKEILSCFLSTLPH